MAGLPPLDERPSGESEPPGVPVKRTCRAPGGLPANRGAGRRSCRAQRQSPARWPAALRYADPARQSARSTGRDAGEIVARYDRSPGRTLSDSVPCNGYIGGRPGPGWWDRRIHHAASQRYARHGVRDDCTLDGAGSIRIGRPPRRRTKFRAAASITRLGSTPSYAGP